MISFESSRPFAMSTVKGTRTNTVGTATIRKKDNHTILHQRGTNRELFILIGNVIFTGSFDDYHTKIITVASDNSPQQMIEITVINLVVNRTKTMTNFWNMSNASAPIHTTAASVK